MKIRNIKNAEISVPTPTIAPQAKPPVCKIMDYGKYKFEQAKREKEAAKKAEKKGMHASRLEFAKDLLAEGESIERTVRLSKLSEAEVRELASKLTA